MTANAMAIPGLRDPLSVFIAWYVEVGAKTQRLDAAAQQLTEFG